MKDLSEDPLFFALQPDLTLPVLRTLRELHAEWDYADAEDMYDDLRERTHAGSLLSGAEPADYQRLCQWMDRAPVRQFVAILNQLFWARRTPGTLRPATEGQLRIITEAQGDAGVDFTPLFPQLSSWMADAVIKAILLISEIQRQTGQRCLSPRHVRAAIREYVQQHYEELAVELRLPPVTRVTRH